jgi:hypothetical protein
MCSLPPCIKPPAFQDVHFWKWTKQYRTHSWAGHESGGDLWILSWCMSAETRQEQDSTHQQHRHSRENASSISPSLSLPTPAFACSMHPSISQLFAPFSLPPPFYYKRWRNGAARTRPALGPPQSQPSCVWQYFKSSLFLLPFPYLVVVQKDGQREERLAAASTKGGESSHWSCFVSAFACFIWRRLSLFSGIFCHIWLFFIPHSHLPFPQPHRHTHLSSLYSVFLLTGGSIGKQSESEQWWGTPSWQLLPPLESGVPQ